MSNSADSEARSYGSENLVSFDDQRARHTSRTADQLSGCDVAMQHSTNQRVVIQTSNAQIAARNHMPSQVMFDRRELNEILRVYGFKVAAGEWRDYAIDHLKDKAVFSVFRKSNEIALFRVEKNPKLSRKQGAYSVVTVAGVVLKRGSDLRQVLRVFEKKTKLRAV